MSKVDGRILENGFGVQKYLGSLLVFHDFAMLNSFLKLFANYLVVQNVAEFTPLPNAIKISSKCGTRTFQVMTAVSASTIRPKQRNWYARWSPVWAVRGASTIRNTIAAEERFLFTK